MQVGTLDRRNLLSKQQAPPPSCGRWLLTAGRPRNPLRNRTGQKSLKDAVAEAGSCEEFHSANCLSFGCLSLSYLQIGCSTKRESAPADLQLTTKERKGSAKPTNSRLLQLFWQDRNDRGWFLQQQARRVYMNLGCMNFTVAELWTVTGTYGADAIKTSVCNLGPERHGLGLVVNFASQLEIRCSTTVGRWPWIHLNPFESIWFQQMPLQ